MISGSTTAYLEIFSPSGGSQHSLDPFDLFTSSLKNIFQLDGNHSHGPQRIYDRDIKGFCIQLSKSGHSFRCERSLGILHTLLVLQLQLFSQDHSAAIFSLEVTIMDKQKQRRRLHFSTNFSHATSNAAANVLHAKIPWMAASPDWANVVLNLPSLVSMYFGAAVEFASLETFSLSPCCKIRKVFCLPSGSISSEAIHIPGQVDFPSGCGRQTVLLPSAPAAASGPPLSIKVPPGPGSASADSRAPASSSSRKGSASGSQLPVQVSDGRGGRQDKQQRRLALQKISSRMKQAAEDPAFPLQPPPPRPPPAVSAATSAATQSPLPSPSPPPAADADCRQLLGPAADPLSGWGGALLLSPPKGSPLGTTRPWPSGPGLRGEEGWHEMRWQLPDSSIRQEDSRSGLGEGDVLRGRGLLETDTEAERETSLHAELPDAAGPEWLGGENEWGKLLESGTISGSKEGKETRRPRSAESRIDPSREVPGRRSSRSEFAGAEENRQDSISVGRQLVAASPSSLCDVQRLPMDEIEASDLHQSGCSWGEEEEEEEEEGGEHVDSEAASAARYLTWLEDRWQ
eukprot:gene25667-33516_t